MLRNDSVQSPPRRLLHVHVASITFKKKKPPTAETLSSVARSLLATAWRALVGGSTTPRHAAPGEWAAVPWRTLDLCVALAVRTVNSHTQNIASGSNSSDDRIPETLFMMDVDAAVTCMIEGVSGYLPILGPLATRYPALVSSLRELKVVSNHYDESADICVFAALATHLTALTFSNCGLTSVQGLEGRCGYLQKVRLVECKRLRNLRGFEHHTRLECVHLLQTPHISSLEPLQTCPALKEVVIFYCRRLNSLDGLQNHQFLKEVLIAWTPITSIEPLRTCPALINVSVSGCEGLTSLEGLEDHQWLEEVSAVCTSIASLDPLRTCPALSKVNISVGCRQLPIEVDLPSTVTVRR